MDRWMQTLAGVVLIAGIGAWGSPAWARQRIHSVPIETAPVDVTLGVTVTGLIEDVNRAPRCVELGLPCTNTSAHAAGGFGLVAAVAKNVNEHVAIVGDVSVYAAQWTSAESLARNRAEFNVVRSALVGPRINTRFIQSKSTTTRFFGQVLVGVEVSDVDAPPGAIQVGGGVDGWDFRAKPAMVRLELDYRLVPGPGRNLSGWRALFGITLGPRPRW
jgi:hypothetical protein